MKTTLNLFYGLLILFCTLSTSNADQTTSNSLQIDVIAKNLGVPWGMAVLPNNKREYQSPPKQ